MITTNENYLNYVNGFTFTSKTLSGRGAPRNSQVVIQQNPYGVRVLGGGARLKNKRQSPPTSLVAAPPMCSLRVCLAMEAVADLGGGMGGMHPPPPA